MRVVRHSHGDVSLDDVKNEAWVIAADMAQKGTPLTVLSLTEAKRKSYSTTFVHLPMKNLNYRSFGTIIQPMIPVVRRSC